MSASGCVSKWLARLNFELADLAVQLGDDGRPAARVVAANAAVIVAGAASCSDRSAVWISRARAAILRCRPPRLERGLDRRQAQVGALLGVGARPSTPRASPWARSSKATSAAG